MMFPASGEQPKEYVCEKMEITKDTKLSINMAAGGGFAIRVCIPPVRVLQRSIRRISPTVKCRERIRYASCKDKENN